MPSMFGGDSTSKDYAPHMYVGDNFIHNTGKKVTVGTTHYYAGMTRDEQLVAERWTDQLPTRRFVPWEEIPEEVLSAFSQTPMAFADGEKERTAFAQMVNC